MKSAEDEDRILRVWTPVVLRASLFTSVVILVAGLIVMAIRDPGVFVERVHALQHGATLAGRQPWASLLSGALRGNPHDTLTIGLLVLTMVPLGRVGLSLFFFIRGRDLAFVLLTAYVLAMLILGVTLGRIG